jgi:hypothetical protein
MNMEEISDELENMLANKEVFSITRLMDLKKAQEHHSTVNVMGMALIESLKEAAFRTNGRPGMESLCVLLSTAKKASVLPASLKQEVYETLQKSVSGF